MTSQLYRGRRARQILLICTVLTLLAGVIQAPLAQARSTATWGPAGAYRTQLLHFLVHVGPGRTEACDILGELYTPQTASAAHRVPAILTTNGFGGSYTDQAGLGVAFASHGYVVLTYSGLGFGGSGCQITLDDPTYDGAAASQLVSFLGGENGIAFTDAGHTQAVAGLDDVIHDAVDHDGHHDRYDPRVGMIGGSYGGEVQFAAAAVDPRIDAIVPFITWSNLNYSLAPNNADLAPGAGVTSSVPGVAKSTWALLFTGEGVLDGVEGASADPGRDVGCPNFATWVCPGIVEAGTTGYPSASVAADLAHASVASYLSRIQIPTLLIQGEDDTLFNLNEAIANYQALEAHGVPVSMIWQSWGHSSLSPAPGEIDLNAPDPSTQYETARVVAWFARYLMHEPVSTGPGFAYFRDWVSYTGIASPAYASAASYPVGTTQAWYLSGDGTLVSRPAQLTVGAQTFVTPPAGAPTSITSLDAVPGTVGSGVGDLPDFNTPGTYASWTSAPLTANLDVAGQPSLDVQLVAPSAALSEAAGPAGDLVVFAKLYDVAPDGTASLIHGLVAPARIADVNEPVRITLPAIVHRFAAGDRIRIVLAGGDLNYRGGLVPTLVEVTTGNTGQVLTLPVVG